MRVAPPILLTEEDRSQLERWARGRSIPQRLVQRANVLLRAAAGEQTKTIAEALSIAPATAARWRRRFLEQGLSGIVKDAPRPGRPPRIATKTVEEIVRRTTQETPANATQWSTRSMAKASGVSEATIRRIWHSHGLKPHLIRTFKLSTDPHFSEKLEDVVGLYLNPPEHAIVLALDEKTRAPRGADVHAG